MRKLFVYIALLVSGLVVVACSGLLSDEEVIALAKQLVTIDSELSGDINLPTEINSVTITWSSSNQEHLTNTGIVIRPSFVQGDVEILLTASFTYNSASDTQVYNVTVLSLEQTEEERIAQVREEKLQLVPSTNGLNEEDYTISSWQVFNQAVLFDIAAINSLLTSTEIINYQITASLNQLVSINSLIIWFEQSHVEVLSKSIETIRSSDLIAVQNAIVIHDTLPNEVRTHLVLHKQMLEELLVRINQIIIDELALAKAEKIVLLNNRLSSYQEIDYTLEKWNEISEIKAGAIAVINQLVAISDVTNYDLENIIAQIAVVTIGTSDVFEGSGSQRYPYLIKTADDLIYLRNAVNEAIRNLNGQLYNGRDVNFALNNDISLNDLSDFATWAIIVPANSWLPIGYTVDFIANFDGQNHEISGIYINQEGEDLSGFGLFGMVMGNIIKNLILNKNYIETSSFNGATGTLVGITEGSTISNITVLESYVTGYEYAEAVGGVIGKANNSQISNIANYATVKTLNEGVSFTAVGGIAGIILDSSIADSWNFGTIIGGGGSERFAGGIVGLTQTFNGNNYLNRVNNYGRIELLDGFGDKYAGGIVGKVSGATFSIAYYISEDEIPNATLRIEGDINIYISNSLNSGTIVASDGIIGGIVGQIQRGGVVHNYFIDQIEDEVLGGGTDYREVVPVIIENRITDSNSVGEIAVIGAVIPSEHVYYHFYPNQ